MSDSFFHGIEVDDDFRLIQTTSSSVIGLIGVDEEADSEAFPINTPVLLTGDKCRMMAKLTPNGTLYKAIEAIETQQNSTIVLIRCEKGETDEATLQNIIGDLDPTTGNYADVQAFCSASTSVHVVPKILIASGFFTAGSEGKADPLVSAMIHVAEKLHAIVVADGQNTTDEAVVGSSKAAGNPRVYMIDPYVVDTQGNAVPSSPFVAGLMSKVDTQKGFWYSPSNQVIQGITSTARPIDFALGNYNCRAQYLNEHGVATLLLNTSMKFSNSSD